MLCDRLVAPTAANGEKLVNYLTQNPTKVNVI